MRFCPFCAQENPDDARECGHCGKRLPPPRTVAPRAAPPPPVAQRPKREIPPRPAPRSMPIRGKDPLPERPSETAPAREPSLSAELSSDTAPVERSEAFDQATTRVSPATSAFDQATTRVSAPPGARPEGPLSGATSSAATLTDQPVPLPVPDDDRTKPHLPPPPPQPKKKAPTGTLLGMTAQDVGAQPTKTFPDEDGSARRETKPLNVSTAAAAAQRKMPPTLDGANVPPSRRGVSALAPTLAVPANATPPPLNKNGAAFDEDKSTVVDPRAPRNPPPPAVSSPIDMAGDTEDNEPDPSLSATPILPTMALPPMPPPPRSTKILEAVMYLPPLAKAIWARKKAQDHIRTLLHGDQRLLDQVLRDLGRAAREAMLDVPAVADEMRRVKAEEDRRAAADAELMRIDQGRDNELQRWGAEEAERNQEIAQKEVETKAAEDELKQKGDERRTHDAERAKIDGQIRALEKKAAQEDARALKAESTPPEKGGGPNTAANARAAAEAARKEATALIPARDVAKARVEALDGPIAVLTKQVVDGRADLQSKKKELVEAQAAHKRTLAQLEMDKRKAEAEREGAEREMSQRFVAAGTLLNLNRVEGDRFKPLYERIDELKAGVNAREAAIVRLESERRSYDKPAVQKGLITIGVAVGALILLLIILSVLLARH